MVKFHNSTFSRFCMIHPCDGQTDGRAIAYSALSIYAMLSHTKNGVSVASPLSLHSLSSFDSSKIARSSTRMNVDHIVGDRIVAH